MSKLDDFLVDSKFLSMDVQTANYIEFFLLLGGLVFLFVYFLVGYIKKMAYQMRLLKKQDQKEYSNFNSYGKFFNQYSIMEVSPFVLFWLAFPIFYKNYLVPDVEVKRYCNYRILITLIAIGIHAAVIAIFEIWLNPHPSILT